MVNIIFAADSQRAYSQLIKIREKLEIITDLNIKALIGI